jgi:polyphosphate kinase
MYYYTFFNRDISWLSFNERVLMEAAAPDVPLMERLKFLSIFSSNLDEFFRVRIPAIQSLHRLSKKEKEKEQEQTTLQTTVTEIIYQQQEKFGQLLAQTIIPQLKSEGVYIVYNEPISSLIIREAEEYFFHSIASFIKITCLDEVEEFFPENNKLYLAVTLNGSEETRIALLNIPSDEIDRFFIIKKEQATYVVFIEDIIQHCLDKIFPSKTITGAYRIKVTRDAELELMDEFDGDISEKIEQQIKKRDFGKATRLLYSPGLPPGFTKYLVSKFNLVNTNVIQGGNYHNLKDFINLPRFDDTYTILHDACSNTHLGKKKIRCSVK